jgi:hypothetical protein
MDEQINCFYPVEIKNIFSQSGNNWCSLCTGLVSRSFLNKISNENILIPSTYLLFTYQLATDSIENVIFNTSSLLTTFKDACFWYGEGFSSSSSVFIIALSHCGYFLKLLSSNTSENFSMSETYSWNFPTEINAIWSSPVGLFMPF